MLARSCIVLLVLVGLIGCSGDNDKKAEQKAAAEQPYRARVAEVGVGKRGRKLEKRTGATARIVAGPAVAYFHVKEKAAFAKVEYAMKLYKAQHGRLPKSHAAFMRDIVEFNNIELPELPDNAKYEYRPRPRPGKLWVVPKSKPLDTAPGKPNIPDRTRPQDAAFPKSNLPKSVPKSNDAVFPGDKSKKATPPNPNGPQPPTTPGSSLPKSQQSPGK